MPITNYSQLKATVADYMQRGDLTSQIADCVTLAESYLNRALPLRVQEATTTLTGTTGLRTLALPSDYVEPYTLDLTTFGVYTRLRPTTADNIDYSLINGTPKRWLVTGANIELDCPCDQAHTFAFRYRQSFALSDQATTNWLLTNHPDVYLFATLVEAYAIDRDAEAAAAWMGRRDQVVEEVSWKEARSKAPATLAVDPGLQRRNDTFNIVAGT